MIKMWRKQESLPNYKYCESWYQLALQLYSDADICYMNGAFMATCAMCRATAQALLFERLAMGDFVIYKEGRFQAIERRGLLDYSPRGLWNKIQIKYLNKKYRAPQFHLWKLAKIAKQHDVIDSATKKHIEFIRKTGNFSSHPEGELHRVVMEGVYNKYGKKGYKPNLKGKKYRNWVSEAEAQQVLNRTTAIMRYIFETTYTRYVNEVKKVNGSL